MPMVEKLISNNITIAALNYNSIIEITQYLNIETEILLSSKIEKNNELKGESKVLHINKILGADTYYNAIGGQQLYSQETFQKNGLDLHFIKMKEIKYKQYNNEFVSGLSIIDVLMFNSSDEIRKMLNEYTLI